MKKLALSAAAFAPTLRSGTRPNGNAVKQALAVALFFASATPASATSLVADGITYTLTLNSISGDDLTAFFTFTASGENTASDTEGGTSAHRTGINAIAFNQPSNGTVTSGTMTSPTGFAFQLGGLNSSGCSGSGNFFCFDNTAIPPTPTTDLSGLLTFNFNVTTNKIGLWENYATDLKIDWVGANNNYDLVSLPIPVNKGGGPFPNPFSITPEPATWAMMLLGFGFVGAAMRRRKQHQAVRLTYA